MNKKLDLGSLGLDRGGHILLQKELQGLAAGESLSVCGSDPNLAVHLRGWCRAKGYPIEIPKAPPVAEVGATATEPTEPIVVAVIGASPTEGARWSGAERAGRADPTLPDAIAEHASSHWGLAARGATVEAGSPDFDFTILDKDTVWADEAARLYRQAAANQWDPNAAINWDVGFEIPDEVENAVVQIMTYLVENEHAALVIPARFAGRIHPHFKEIVQLLAIQAADEARHVEVFTRRATLRGRDLGLSTAGGQESLKTLLEEPDFALAAFLLSVLGEGTFLSLLWFLHANAPDPVTQQVCKLAAQDEARHVAFGMAHLKRHIEKDPTLKERLASAVERRHDVLQHTAGLNSEVFDALVVLAAGRWDAEAIEEGYARVLELQQEMDTGRQQRLLKLGFDPDEAARLSGLHTRNFM